MGNGGGLTGALYGKWGLGLTNALYKLEFVMSNHKRYDCYEPDLSLIIALSKFCKIKYKTKLTFFFIILNSFFKNFMAWGFAPILFINVHF